MRKLLPIVEGRVKPVLERISESYSITLEVAETRQKVTILFDHGCKLTDEEGEDRLLLDRCRMVRLLFGQSKPSDVLNLDGKAASYLDLILPLPFHMWKTDTR